MKNVCLKMEDGENEFDASDFEQKLTKLKDTQEGIQGMSAWCLAKRQHHKKIVNIWLNVLKNVRVDHRLTLFYLANDVIQHSKRKNYEFVESWGTALQRATTLVREERVKQKISRIFKIWGERNVYNEEFLTDLNGLLSMAPPRVKSKDPNADPEEYQVQSVVQSIRKCVVLQGETDRSLKAVIKTTLPEVDGALKGMKDRSKVRDLQKEVDEAVRRYERYMTNLQREIKTREALLVTLQEADEFYQTQRGEVKVVAGAYKNFGNRIRALKKKLDEMRLPSPIPSPPANAPSPGPDNDFDLPSTTFTFNNGSFIGSYMDSSLPFDPMDFARKSPSPQSIQVISNNASDSYNGPTPNDTINDFFKTLMPDSYDPAGSFSTDYSLSDINMSYSGVPPPAAPLPAYAPITMTSTFGMAGKRANPPPPVPPRETFNQAWSDGAANWDPSQFQSTVYNALANAAKKEPETPRSPPHYDRKAPPNSRPREYVDIDNGGGQTGALDVDHRALALDIHHRNLISLTGSPGQSASHKKKGSEDIDLRGLTGVPQPPPPPSIKESEVKDADFRVHAPPLPPESDADLRSLFSNLPPILEPPSLVDLEKLLNTDDRDGNKKKNGQSSNDEAHIVDMDLSDDEKDSQPVKSQEMPKEPPLPPNFGDFNEWDPSPPPPSDMYDPGMGNEYGDSGFGNNFSHENNRQWSTPPPPMPPNHYMGPQWNMGGNQHGGGGLLPTPNSGQQRFMGGPMGGRPPFSPRNGPGNFGNFNSGFRGRGGRGSPYFRGGGGRGHFNRGRGRW